MYHRIILICLLIRLGGYIALHAQQNIPARPKVGLVLSGGGAKGLAHIGVLKVLEEVGLRPDYITGTSMGSIVGGLYSIGFTADELSNMNRQADWNTLLSDDVSLQNIAMEEKSEYNRYMIELPVYDRRISLPPGVLEGQNLSMFLSGMTWRTIGTENFDEYPYPFRCVGTEIVNGEIIVFGSGDLARAMRASMAIPSIFTPVVLDSAKVVVDGGVLRNFPVEEVISMGADIVIGVYTGFKENIKADELNSLTKILARSSSLYGINDTREQEKLVDILITPDLSAYSSSDFSRNLAIEQAGETAARNVYDRLKSLADSLNQLAKVPEPAMLEERDSILIQSLRVENLKNMEEGLVIGLLNIKEGEYVTREELFNDLDRLFGTLYFDRLTYRLESESNGFRLILDIKEKQKAAARFAVHYDNFYGAGVLMNYSHHDFLLSGSKLSVSADVSEYPQGRLYFHKYVGKEKNVLAVTDSYFESNLIPVFADASLTGYFRQQHFTSELLLRRIISLNQQAGVGVLFEYSSVRPDKVMQQLYPEEFNYRKYGFHGMGFSAQYLVNTLDNLFYPFRGHKFELTVKGIFNPGIDLSLLSDTIKSDVTVGSFGKLHLSLDNYRPLGEKTSLNTYFSMGFSNDELIISDYFFVGGHKYNTRRNQIGFAGYNLGEIAASNFLMFRLGVHYRIINLLQVELVANGLMRSDSFPELVTSVGMLNKEDLHLGFGGGLTYNTRFGPLSVFLSGNNRDARSRWYVNLGFTF